MAANGIGHNHGRSRSVWERLFSSGPGHRAKNARTAHVRTTNTPAVPAAGGSEGAPGAHALGDDAAHGHRKAGERLPADIRQQAEREACRRVLAIHVFVTKSGRYWGITADDQPNLAKYRGKAREIAIVQPKVPSLRSLVAAMPRTIRTQAEREATRRGIGVVVFLLKDGSYVAVTEDDAPMLERYRARRAARELMTVAPAMTKGQRTERREQASASAEANAAPEHETHTPTARRPRTRKERPPRMVEEPPRRRVREQHAEGQHTEGRRTEGRRGPQPTVLPPAVEPEMPTPIAPDVLPPEERSVEHVPAEHVPAERTSVEPAKARAPRKRTGQSARTRTARTTVPRKETVAPPSHSEAPHAEAPHEETPLVTELQRSEQTQEDANLDKAEAMMASLQKLLENALKTP